MCEMYFYRENSWNNKQLLLTSKHPFRMDVNCNFKLRTKKRKFSVLDSPLVFVSEKTRR